MRLYCRPVFQQVFFAEPPDNQQGSSGSHNVDETATPPTFVTRKLEDESFSDNLLQNQRLIELVEECVALFDELDRYRQGMSNTGNLSVPELAEHVSVRLEEMLEQVDVEVIRDETVFDRHRHKPDSTSISPEQQHVYMETLSPGFAVGRRVLRRASVHLSSDLS